MDSITQDMKFRLSLINYADKYGVTKAAIKYKTNRQYTKHFKSDKPSLFEKTLSELGIKHKLIRPFTPRHNG